MKAAARFGRIAVVLSHPTQYYGPWLRWLCTRTGLDLRVFYLWDAGVTPRDDPEFSRSVQWDTDLLSGYPHEFSPNRSPSPGAGSFRGFDNPDLLSRLERWKPDAVLLFGYAWASHLMVLAWARSRGVPVLLRGDSHGIGRPAPSLRKKAALGLLLSQVDAFLCVGAANREYFASFGVPQRRLFFCPHCVDSQVFDPRRPQVKRDAAAFRAEIGAGPGTLVVFFAGKFVANKRPVELVRAFAAVSPRDAVLVMAGDGEQRGQVEQAVREAGARVFLAGFANQSRMPALYAASDLFVLPSEAETWGLSVNEAMGMGVPCLVGDHAGCLGDLVTPGVTGWSFAADRIGTLEGALRGALESMADAGQAQRLRQAALERVSRYSFAAAARGLIEALDFVQERARRP